VHRRLAPLELFDGGPDPRLSQVIECFSGEPAKLLDFLFEALAFVAHGSPHGSGGSTQCSQSPIDAEAGSMMPNLYLICSVPYIKSIRSRQASQTNGRNRTVPGTFPLLTWRVAMDRYCRILVLAACMTWPAAGSAQNQPTPSRDDAERNAFQTPTTGSSRQSGPQARDNNPLSGSQGPATNPEAKNITEPTNRPATSNPGHPDK
jgi:hypothetical protein